MKNANYNLVKLLLSKLDDTWRMEKHYAKDAAESGCPACKAMIEKLIADDSRHSEMLREELARHIKDKIFE